MYSESDAFKLNWFNDDDDDQDDDDDVVEDNKSV